jgi:glycosyltransferase involved in cell wall biosynthesis
MNASLRRPVILCFVPHYLPGFRAGGPLRTIANFVDHFGNEFDIRIVTRDRDLQAEEPYSGVQVDNWNLVGNAQVFYASKTTLRLDKIAHLLRETPHDVLYLNGFFNPAFTVLPLFVRRLNLAPKAPCVIAPRGQLSPSALALKFGKKRLYLAVSRLLGLYRGLRWQASSDYEKTNILRCLSYLNESDVHVALDLAPIELQKFRLDRVRVPGEPLRVCFLSRISPEKNLDFALRVLTHVQSKVVFTIYGPIEVPAYWLACQELIPSLPTNVQVFYGGEVRPIDVKERLTEQDLFFLPTRGENYGHVIHEALSAGLPVLISDQTPWQEVNMRGVGWTFSLNSEKVFAQQIDTVAAWSAELAAETRHSAQVYARELANDPAVLKANRTLFIDVLPTVCM